MTGTSTGSYAAAFHRSLNDPEGFWGEAAEAIDWYEAPKSILDASNPPFYRWFPDGVLNTCHNALDRHVDSGRGEQLALIYDSPVAGKQRRYRRRCGHHPGRIASRRKYQRDRIRAARPLAAGYPGIGSHQIVIRVKVCQLTPAAQRRHIHG